MTVLGRPAIRRNRQQSWNFGALTLSRARSFVGFGESGAPRPLPARSARPVQNEFDVRLGSSIVIAAVAARLYVLLTLRRHREPAVHVCAPGSAGTRLTNEPIGCDLDVSCRGMSGGGYRACAYRTPRETQLRIGVRNRCERQPVSSGSEHEQQQTVHARFAPARGTRHQSCLGILTSVVWASEIRSRFRAVTEGYCPRVPASYWAYWRLPAST